MRKSLAVMLAASLALTVFAALPAEAKKKKKPKPCAAYVPGDLGADAGDTLVITDAATEEAPLEAEATAGPGFVTGLGSPPDQESHSYYNIQVDSKAKTENLYVRLEWSDPPIVDYDLYVKNPDGTDAANAHGFNPASDSQFSPESDGGHTEANAEQVDGVSVADCQGFTVDVSTASAEGGTLTLKYWLGDPPA